MNILVVGCGKVGSKVASDLSRMGHDVSVVDRSEKRFALLDEDFSGLTVCGVPIDQDVLKLAGVESCDALAAMTEDDNVNITVSEVARELFHVPSVLARIYDPRRENVFSHFGLSTVCPTNLTAASVISTLTQDYRPEFVSFGDNTVCFSLISIPEKYEGAAFGEIGLEDQVVLGIMDETGTLLMPPDPMFVLTRKCKILVGNRID